MTKLIEITGKAISGEWGSEDSENIGIPVLRTTNFTNEGIIDYSNVVTRVINKKNIDNKFLKQGDIILEKSGGSDNQPVGRVVYFEGPVDKYLYNNFTGLLRVKNSNKWDSKYIFWTLYAAYKQGKTVMYQNRTTGLHNLRTDAYIQDLEVKPLSLQEQKNISKTLDKTCHQIKIREKELSKLDILIKARFVEMFGNLTINDKKWETMDLDSVFNSITSSKRILKSQWRDKGIPFLRVRDLVQLAENNALNNEFFISKDLYSELSDKDGVPKRGDILVSATSTLGKCHIVLSNEQFYFKDADILRFRPSDKINAVFFKECMNDNFIKGQINKTLGVTTVKHFTIKAAKTIFIRIPPLSLQNKFAEFVQQVDKSKVAIQKSLDETQTLFDSLMQKYFS